MTWLAIARRQSRGESELDPYRLPERAVVLTIVDPPDQPAPLPGRQLGVGRLADQRIPEQANRAGPFGPNVRRSFNRLNLWIV